MKINGNTKIVCSECGSTDIWEKQWFNPNTGDNKGWDESDECYCTHCQKMTRWREVTEIYSEVKCTHHADGFWVVDAWKTADQNEEGRVIALINDVTGDVYALAPLDDKAKGVIDEKQTEIVSQDVEILAEKYNSMVDSKKDEFLRLTDNQ